MISYRQSVSVRASQRRATTFVLLLAEMILLGRNLLACSNIKIDKDEIRRAHNANYFGLAIDKRLT